VPVSRLFRWTGKAADKPVMLKEVDLKGLNPEGLAVFPNDQCGSSVMTEGWGVRMRLFLAKEWRAME
jgi:hypothetical protein